MQNRWGLTFIVGSLSSLKHFQKLLMSLADINETAELAVINLNKLQTEDPGTPNIIAG